MRYMTKAVLPALVLLCCLGASSVVQAAEPGVVDNAKIFSLDVVTKANAVLKEIKERTGKTMIIETYQGIPADKRDAFRANRNKFYQDWIVARGRRLELEGTLFLVVNETAADVAAGSRPTTRVEYWSDSKTRQLLKQEEADRIKNTLGKQLHSDPNKGLLEAVNQAKQAMVTHFGQNRPSREIISRDTAPSRDITNPTSNNPREGRMEISTLIIWIVVGLIAFWILIGLVRAFNRPRMPMGGGPQYQGGRGGPMQGAGYGGQPYGQAGYGQPMGYPQQGGGGMGFMGSLMAGMFGAAAGNYLYDRFARGGNHGGDYGGTSAGTTGGVFGGSDSPQTGYVGGGDFAPEDSPGAAPNYDADITSQSDFGGAGGDFASNTGGGGDFSGGDFGGGGGDTGGGGDFGGGGGGDFGGGGGDFGGGGGDVGGGGGDFGGGGGDF